MRYFYESFFFLSSKYDTNVLKWTNPYKKKKKTITVEYLNQFVYKMSGTQMKMLSIETKGNLYLDLNLEKLEIRLNNSYYKIYYLYYKII